MFVGLNPGSGRRTGEIFTASRKEILYFINILRSPKLKWERARMRTYVGPMRKMFGACHFTGKPQSSCFFHFDIRCVMFGYVLKCLLFSLFPPRGVSSRYQLPLKPQ